MMKTAAVSLFAALLLAGCGGDHLSWCYGSGDGRVQAGYNSSCRGGDAGTKGAAADDVAEDAAHAADEGQGG